MKVPFSPPDIGDKEIENVIEVLKSGWITTGPKTKLFEKRIAEYCGVNKAVCLNSQTACAELILRILGIGEGDEVITTAYTYTATASVILHVGAKPVLVDINKDNLEMDYRLLEKAITDKTKAVIAVDVAGIICDYGKIYQIVDKHKGVFKPNSPLQQMLGRIAVISDSAHSFGAEQNGKMAGSIADFSAFSFHAVKNLTTGEGGAFTWRNDLGFDDEDIYKTAQLLSLHGQSKDALSKSSLGQWEYDVKGAFYKCNMTDIMASIGLAQLDRYPEMLKRRKDIIEKYNYALKDFNVKVLNHYTENSFSSGHLYIVKILGINEQKRNDIIVEMAKRGVALNVHYKPLPLLTAYKNLGYGIKDYSNAFNSFACAVTLPLNTCLTDEQVNYVILNFTEILKETKC